MWYLQLAGAPGTFPLNKKPRPWFRPWLQPAAGLATRRMLFLFFRNLPSLHFKYFRGRRRTTRTEMSSSRQAEVGATQGYNCLLYFHFPPIISERERPRALQTTKKRRGVPLASNHRLIDREQEVGRHRLQSNLLFVGSKGK